MVRLDRINCRKASQIPGTREICAIPSRSRSVSQYNSIVPKSSPDCSTEVNDLPETEAVSHRRLILLAFGPLAIVAAAYWLTMIPPVRAEAEETREAPPQSVAGSLSREQSDALAAACRKTSEEIATSLNSDCRIIVAPPFVIAGDLSAEKLRSYEREFVTPIRHALETSYFDRKPNEPIVLLMFSTDKSFRQHAKQFDGNERSCYSGYYQRNSRRILLNISTGDGTLAHELTHALAHFDFPEIPEWFDEGLASLHEQCEFSDDDLRLTGLDNWRLNVLRPEAQSGRLASIEAMMGKPSVRGPREAVHYAHARYFCLYLQERRLLEPFYRKFRALSAVDSTGVVTLKELLHTDSLDDFDRKFRAWVSEQRSGATKN